MRLAFESRAEKTVPITVLTVGQPPRGFRVDRIVASPSQVTVRGAQSVVAATSTVNTVEVSLDDRRASFHETVALQAPEQYVTVLGAHQVEVDVAMIEEVSSREVGPLPVTIRAAAGVPPAAVSRFTPEPAEVKLILRGPLLAVEEVAPEALAVYAEIYASDVAAARERTAPLVVEGVPKGVALELSNREVVLHPKP